MKLENQVVNLELAKKMRDLGFKQESIFIWFNTSGIVGDFFWVLGYLDEINDHGVRPNDYCSAYTVAELGEMIEEECVSYKIEDNNGWRCDFTDTRGVKENLSTSEFAPTEADARAKMLIYLRENKLI